MAKIRILDDSTINRIAAGEVIQRPASVVKELIENAIDAKADRIDISVKNGGKTLIRVDDNGCGMDEEDLLLSTERHGTSKVSDDTEIFGANTLGFRGEALPSIAAISSITIDSCENLNDGGHRLTAVGGTIRDISPWSRAIGTTVEVKKLFYNTPARRKFLKSDSIESSHIREVISGAILTHPEIAFTYRADGRTIFKTAGNSDVVAAISRVFGATDAEKMLKLPKVSCDNLPFSIYGAISNGLASRSAANCIVTSVNGRVFKSYQMNRIIQQIFSPYIAPKRWPLAVLFIEADPRIVDVNVHPSKLEVRFNFFEKLGRFISSTIKDLINQAVPLMDLPAKTGNTPHVQHQLFDSSTAQSPASEPALIRERPSSRTFASTANFKSSDPLAGGYDPATAFSPQVTSDNQFTAGEFTSSDKASFPLDNFNEQAEPQIDETRSLTILGQVFLSYIVALRNDVMLLCDQHAAHERILYEKTVKRLSSGENNVQMLLVPQDIKLSADRIELLKENLKDIEKTGLIVDFPESKPDTITVKGLPSLFENQNLTTVVLDILDSYTSVSTQSIEEDQKTKNSASIACKAAIKANQSLTMNEMKLLITDLFKCNHPTRCPHGRPTVIEVSQEQLEKSFLRRQ